MSLGDEADLLREIDDLKAALNRQTAATRRAKARVDDLVGAVYQAARDAALSAPRPTVIRPTRDRRRGKEEVALLHTTDWQLGKRTATYSVDVCRRRIQQYVEKVIHITEIQRTHHPVRKAVLLVGGDMVEGGGNIFPGQVHEIEAHLFEQIFATASLLESVVRSLAAEFELEVVCEWGNHGRLGRYGDGTYAADNADRMVYRIVEEKVADLGIRWQASDAGYQIVEVGNYRILLIHGDEIKSFGGNTPAFGILRKITAWASGVYEPFTDAYLGHFHSSMALQLPNGGRIFVTGSPEDSNEYAREFVAATSRPSQRLHFVDPEAGRVASEYVLWLD